MSTPSDVALDVTGSSGGGSVAQAALDHQVTAKIVDGILAGGTTSTLAILLLFVLVSLVVTYALYRKSESANTNVIAKLEAEKSALTSDMKAQQQEHVTKMDTLRAEMAAKVQSERDRAEREILQIQARMDSLMQSTTNDYKNTLAQLSTSLTAVDRTLIGLRDSILGAYSARAFPTAPAIPALQPTIPPPSTEGNADEPA